ncbi:MULTISPECIES: hypothetical protein [Actinoalloteichus]|uniref:Uncharacterized protein n=1 Tax=Actinoalloteichus fjordicus TaxID=1612552 RepID=A0AAC9LDG2_9PSEU|nr:MULTISPECIES: hypothetical protein [Actinoalloteichus]APU14805.1 hypothetical protein UA74_13735 [Actinoalloteichus fjordicus]APU20776.1 hypothetical protein UA75_13830 [Actinoalloteichus sp. GBA129-24]
MTPTVLAPTPPRRRQWGQRAETADGPRDCDAAAVDRAVGTVEAPDNQRWAGRFRRLEHRRDDGYRSVTVAVCGAVLVPVDEWVRLLRCATCFPAVDS